MKRTLTLRASQSQGGSLGDTKEKIILPRWLAMRWIEELAHQLNRSDVSSPELTVYGDAEQGEDEGDWI